MKVIINGKEYVEKEEIIKEFNEQLKEKFLEEGDIDLKRKWEVIDELSREMVK